MGKKSGPKAPDPMQTAKAEADLNRINQTGPYGSLQYGSYDANGNFTPTAGRETAVQTETPEAKAIRERQQALSQGLMSNNYIQNARGRVSDINLGALPESMNWQDVGSNLPAFRSAGQVEGKLPGMSTDFSGDSQAAADATFQQGMSRLSPLLEERRRRAENDLVNRGLPVGGEADTNRMNQVSNAENDAVSNLAMASILAGNQRQSDLFGQQLAARQGEYGIQSGLAGLTAAQRGQMFGEDTTKFGLSAQQREQALQEQQAAAQASLAKELGLGNLNLSRLQTGAQMGSGQNNYVNVPQIDYTGLVNGQYAAKAQQTAGNNQALGGLLGAGANAGATYLMLSSDIRLKERIVPVGESNGFNLYEFSYKGDSKRYRGVMAQEVEKTRPDAVVEIDGFKAVNYGAIGVPFELVA